MIDFLDAVDWAKPSSSSMRAPIKSLATETRRKTGFSVVEEAIDLLTLG
jgi:hypothetical protein